jgi:hypothetical protein
MPDPHYAESVLLFKSKGIFARQVDDLVDPQGLLNECNVEELAEGAYAQKLGSVIVNSTGVLGGEVYPLSGKCVSLFKLGQLAGAYARYCVTADGSLWRRGALTPGAFTKISTSFSGNPCSIQSFSNTDFTSTVSAFFSDSNGFWKDDGTFSAPQQGGIFPPQFPVTAQSQSPTTLVVLDDYVSDTTPYTFSATSSDSIETYVNTNLSSAVKAIGIQEVTYPVSTAVADNNAIYLFQHLTIDTGSNQETVLVLLVTPTGFVADFTKTHSVGASISSLSLSVIVPASTTATITAPFSGLPIGPYPIPSSETVSDNQSDYIGLYMFVSDQTQIQSITLSFDCGDGSFESDYFYKVISQGPLQELTTLATSSASGTSSVTTLLTEAVLEDSLSLYGNGAGSIGELDTGKNIWTPLLFQLSDFSGAGMADYKDAVYNWSNVNGYQITIVMNDNSSSTIKLSSLVLFGGAGPDTLGGVAYDYVATFLNDVDGTESNPSPIMTNQNPPNHTNWVYPRRQPVLLKINTKTYGPAGQLQDGQIGYLRIYRRGGTYGDNFRRIDEIPISIEGGGIVQYTDTAPDYLIAGADMVSFTNDVPVPSLLPVPVNTTLNAAIVGTLQVSPSITGSNPVGSTWVNPTNATSSSLYTSVSAPASQGIGALQGDFSLPSIPLTATITGIKVSFDAYTSVLGPKMTASINIPGAALPAEISLTLAPQTYVFGGSGNLWGTTITPAIVNADFTQTLVGGDNLGSSAATVYVNNLVVTIYYTLPDIPVGSVVTINPASMANISVRQQVLLGNPTAQANNFETVVVLTVGVSSFTAFVQNYHAAGEQVQASIKVGQPVYGMVIAFNKAWYWGDPNNPSTLYFSTGNAPQYVGEANNIIISTPDDYITAVVPFKGNIMVSCIKSGWWMVPPDSPAKQAPYPTSCAHGCVAPFGYVATEEMIAYQAADGLRAFTGGESVYMSLQVEFLFQGVGSTPIVEADQTKLSQTVASYWNSMVFFSYIGTDGNRHRLVYHAQYKRFRNDDVDAQCLMLEADTNQLLYGDSNGLVHIDRQNLPYDQVSSGGVLAAGPIAINLQTAYSFQSSPANQKQYNAIVVDCNLGGQTLTVNALFNDGAITVPLGTISNSTRGKINLPLLNGLGQQAYKISLQIVGNLSTFAYLYQAAVEALVLPRTRKTFDTYKINISEASSKFARDVFWIYSAGAPIIVNVFYDDNPTAGFTFVMPQAGGFRNPLRTRLPAISFRTLRMVGTSTEDFILWPDSNLWYKVQCQGRGYEKVLFVEP